jgi:hypothetical protein
MAGSRTASAFEDELQKLFHDWTHELRSSVWSTQGAKPRVNSAKIRKVIAKLQGIAEQHLLASKNTSEVLDGYKHKKKWQVKGRGSDAKTRGFKEWYKQHILNSNNVYAIMRRTKTGSCLYVGKTLGGKDRPTAHFNKAFFLKATRVDVYSLPSKKAVPRFECMLTHRDEPRYSKNKPAATKYYYKCPICLARDSIEREIGTLFRLRS